jgi:hypothetical protein
MLSCHNSFEEAKLMNKKPAELEKEWRQRANILLTNDPDDVAGQAFLKCANDLEFALRSDRGLIRTAIVAGILFSETLLYHPYEWEGGKTRATLAAPAEFPIPTDHSEQPRHDGESFVVSSPAVSGENTASHTVSSSALLSLESQRRVERPFVFSSDFDYAILNTSPEKKRYN